MSTADNLIVPRFYMHSSINETKSKQAGRPIYDDMEVCELRYAGNKLTVGVFPAHEAFEKVDTPDGGREERTYAMAYPDLYKKFKAGEVQALAGTPLEELPFLTQGKRRELKALGIHTAEALAALDGQPLKLLGMGGRELKTQAQAYIDLANKSAGATYFAAENVILKTQIEDLQAQINALSGAHTGNTPPQFDIDADDFPQEDDAGDEIEEFTAAELKAYLKRKTGEPVLGNPSRETLLERARAIENGEAE